MCAQKNIRVLLNTHSRRVHLQRIEQEPLCTPTRTHAFAVTLCTQETRKHTLTHTHTHFWQAMLSVYHQMCLLINRPRKQCGWWSPKQAWLAVEVWGCKKESKNNYRRSFLFLPLPPREVHSVTRSEVGLTITQQKVLVASENKRLHRKKAPVCLRLTFPSRLKSPYAHLLSSTHAHCRAAWKQLRGRSRQCKWKEAGYSSS